MKILNQKENIRIKYDKRKGKLKEKINMHTW